MRRLALLAILGFLSGRSPRTPPPFQIDGRPINPACVYELIIPLSDLHPKATAVDVEGIEKSDEYSDGEVSVVRGGIWYRNPRLWERGYFAYWLEGTTSRGVHVLLTAESGGGSGIFMDVVFVHLSRRAFVTTDGIEQRWILSCLGQITLGDRSDDRVTLRGDVLVIRSPEGVERVVQVPVP